MNVERFQQELALLPVVRNLDSLPVELREAAAASVELRRLVRERMRCDRLLEQAPTIEPPADFVESIVERVLARGPREAPLSGHPSVRPGRFAWLRSPVSLAAAAVVLIAFILIDFQWDAPAPGTDPVESADSVDPEMLASLDLLLDWEALEEHQVELDLLASNELASALDEFGEEADQLR